jgi:transcriptional regulator with XRE-family HTH domain
LVVGERIVRCISRQQQEITGSAKKAGTARGKTALSATMRSWPVRRFRMARGLSQTELGNAVGVTFQQVQKYEKAKNAVAPGRLRQMCEIPRVAPAEMFGGQPKVDGEPVPEMSRWSYRTLIALNKIKSESVKRSIGALIEEMAGSR